jgi:hypothetical protein
MSLSPERAGIVASSALDLRRRKKKTMTATTARNRSEPTTTPTISGVLSVEVGVEATMLVVEEREVVGVEDTCAVVVAFVVPRAVAEDVVVLVAAVVVVVRLSVSVLGVSVAPSPSPVVGGVALDD